jgi:glycosyltransferase involved in cell wall biosynthesis
MVSALSETELPSVSLILPAYNLGDRIEQTINTARRTLSAFVLNYEIIVIDDGSSDDTYERAKSLSDDRVKVIRNPVNQGKGYSFKRGVEEATCTYIMLSDADMDINMSKIISYINALRLYDIVVASKRNRQSTYKAPLARKFLSAAFNALVDAMMGLNVSDTQTGLKAFKTDSIKRIMQFVTVKRYAFDVEMLVVAKLLDLKIVEMPVSVNLDKMFRVKNILYMMVDLLGIYYRYRIIKWYQKNLSNASPKYKPIVRI